MSLTSEISNPESNISLFFKNNFDYSSFIEQTNNELKSFYTLSPNNKQNYPWSDVGHMVEYLMILNMGLPISDLFPLVYAKKIFPNYFSELNKKYQNITGYLKSKDKFNELCNDLFRCSKIEKMIRSGDKINETQIKGFLVNSTILDDMVNIYFKSLKINPIINDLNNKFYYNPTFDLSAFIGGADADLYLIKPNGNTLLDLKTTIRSQITEDMLFQLLGYSFLDLSNQHNFKNVGVYLTRQNLISEWSLSDLVIKNSKFSKYEKAKDSFIDVVLSNYNIRKSNVLKK